MDFATHKKHVDRAIELMPELEKALCDLVVTDGNELCPGCDGLTMVFGAITPVALQCPDCGGTGQVPVGSEEREKKGNRLREIRLQYHANLRDICHLLDMDSAHISKIERGATIVDYERFSLAYFAALEAREMGAIQGKIPIKSLDLCAKQVMAHNIKTDTLIRKIHAVIGGTLLDIEDNKEKEQRNPVLEKVQMMSLLNHVVEMIKQEHDPITSHIDFYPQ